MLWYCGFDAFLQFGQQQQQQQKSDHQQQFLHSLSDLILDKNDKIIQAFIGWCSLFLQTGNGQIIFLGYSKTKKCQQSMTVCSNVPKYIIQIECGSKETFLITLDSKIYRWSGFNFEKTAPELIEFNQNQNNQNNQEEDKILNNHNNNNNKDDEKINVEQLCLGVEYSCLLTDKHRCYLFDHNELQILKPISNETDIIVSISVGQEHILLLSDDGIVYSYGNNSRGQLGNGTILSSTNNNNQNQNSNENAKIIEALEGIQCKAIAAGGWHSIALSNIGDVYVWGWNETGQLGFNRDKIKIETIPTLLDISEDDHFISIAAGSRHSMAVSENGILFGWGWNKYGQLGMDSNQFEFFDQPMVIPFDHKVSNVYCKYWSSLIETKNDESSSSSDEISQ